jgi:hypothetical protein
MRAFLAEVAIRRSPVIVSGTVTTGRISSESCRGVRPVS